MKLCWMAAVALLLAGCISQNITPVAGIADGNVCVVRNPSVRSAVLEIYVAELTESGYQPAVVDDDTPAAAGCRVKTYYTATWGFHWSVYLSTASIEVYQDGRPAGMAKYRAPYASLAKFGRTEPKIRALVKELFPHRG